MKYLIALLTIVMVIMATGEIWAEEEPGFKLALENNTAETLMVIVFKAAIDEKSDEIKKMTKLFSREMAPTEIHRLEGKYSHDNTYCMYWLKGISSMYSHKIFTVDPKKKLIALRPRYLPTIEAFKTFKTPEEVWGNFKEWIKDNPPNDFEGVIF